jgi:rhodanese-related sulfurtransferase
VAELRLPTPVFFMEWRLQMKRLLLCSVAILFLGGMTAQAAPMPDGGQICTKTMQRAEKSFKKADYKQAAGMLRQEIKKLGDKACDKLWSKYRRAVLAEAGDIYLQGVPKDRYRVPAAIFGSDYKKEGIRKYFLLDVRQPKEFVKSHIAGSLNVPFRQVLRHLAWLPRAGKDKVLLIICRSQHRANHVLVVLRELGYTNAYTLQGGYHAYRKWLEKGAKEGKGTAPATPPKDEEEEDFSC